MHRIWIGLFCICLLFGTICSAKAADDLGPEAKKHMSIVLSELTLNSYENVQSKNFSKPEQRAELLAFAAYYVDTNYSLSKTRITPTLPRKYTNSFSHEPTISLKDVKSIVKRFFDYDLPAIPIGEYDSAYFDGKDFRIIMASGGIVYFAQVQEAKRLKTGNIAVKGVLRGPDERDEDPPFIMGSFTAELKPILWRNMSTYAVVSLKSVWKGN